MPKSEDQQPKGDTTGPKIGQINEAEVTEEESFYACGYRNGQRQKSSTVTDPRESFWFLTGGKAFLWRGRQHSTGAEVKITLANLKKEFGRAPERDWTRPRRGIVPTGLLVTIKALATFLYRHLEELNSWFDVHFNVATDKVTSSFRASSFKGAWNRFLYRMHFGLCASR